MVQTEVVTKLTRIEAERMYIDKMNDKIFDIITKISNVSRFPEQMLEDSLDKGQYKIEIIN